MSNYRRARVPGGSYFFTLVSHDRRPVLTGENVRVALREAVQAVRDEHPFFVEAWVLLPDHLHCIWRLPEDDSDYALRWAQIKRFTRHRLGMPSEGKLWQPRYWEHCIRDENDFARHVDYIHWNPVKHGLVNCAADWPYSTFHRFVAAGGYPRDWGIADERMDDRGFGE
ncbi:MAG: transposase [Gallionellales bacterium GWA2_59_43]|nr:MAG: transposase [Gallionellales bacterium GWA2_59_43]